MFSGLYRARRTSDKVWKEGYLLYDVTGNPLIVSRDDVQVIDGHIVISDLVEQYDKETFGVFTGTVIKRKNGSEESVFEGDIVSTTRGGRLLVEWDNELNEFWTYHFINGEKRRFCAFMEFSYWELHSVVGNIYDNPDKVSRY